MKQNKRFSPQDLREKKCELFDNSAPYPWIILSLCRCKGGEQYGKEAGQRRGKYQKKERWPLGGPVHHRI